MSSPTVRVVKVGGSLFDWDGLPDSLRKWLAQQQPAANVLLAGGGDLTDIIRRADCRFHLGQEASHSLCLRLLGVSARLLACLLPEAEFFDAIDELRRHLDGPQPLLAVVDPEPILSAVEAELPGGVLPHHWRVTSDSIATRVAEALSAELVLLKSAEPPAGSLAELSESGYVDGHFAAAAANLPRLLRFVNLRGAPYR